MDSRITLDTCTKLPHVNSSVIIKFIFLGAIAIRTGKLTKITVDNHRTPESSSRRYHAFNYSSKNDV